MLLTDYEAITIDDLLKRQADVEADADNQANQVDLTNKINDAIRQAGINMHRKAVEANSYAIAANQSRNSVLHDSEGLSYRFANGRVVLDDALQSYIESMTLELLYEEMGGIVSGSDRFDRRRSWYRGVAKEDWNNLVAIGIPLVNFPLPRPLRPTLSSVAGGALAARVYYVRISWESSATSSFDDTMSAASAFEYIQVPVNTVLHVSIANLVPPAGQLQLDAGSSVKLGTAAYWNVYVGTEEGNETFQERVAIGTTTWTESTSGITTSTTLPPIGQEANIRIISANRFMRA
jgi:hypothetical protein